VLLAAYCPDNRSTGTVTLGSLSLHAAESGPLYRRLSDRLRERVVEMKPGDRIESEPELAQTLGVSRFTVAKAIESLVDDGLLVRRQGKGTYVAAKPLKRLPGQLRSFTDSVLAAGRRPRSRLLAFGRLKGRKESSFSANEPLARLDRLRFVDGEPVAIHYSLLPLWVSRRLGLDWETVAAPGFSLYRDLERAGLSVDHCIEELMARLPKPAERDLLKLDANDVVMVIRRQSYGADGRLLDDVTAIHDCRHYSYQALLVRSPEHGIPSAFAATESRNGKVISAAKRFGPNFGARPRRARG
jgi:DNA-binding GntR family transcriptional regulator